MDIITLIIIAVAIALDPLPLVPFILLLTSKRGVQKGAAFLVGWLVSLSAIVVLTIVATGNTPPEHGSAPASVASRAKLLFGVVPLITGRRNQRTTHGRRAPRRNPSGSRRSETCRAGSRRPRRPSHHREASSLLGPCAPEISRRAAATRP